MSPLTSPVSSVPGATRPVAAGTVAAGTVGYQRKEATQAFVAELLRAVEKEWLGSLHLPQDVSWAAEGVMAREMAKALAPDLMPKLFPSDRKS